MSAATHHNPSREDIAALLEESFNNAEALEGSVIKGGDLNRDDHA